MSPETFVVFALKFCGFRNTPSQRSRLHSPSPCETYLPTQHPLQCSHIQLSGENYQTKSGCSSGAMADSQQILSYVVSKQGAVRFSCVVSKLL